MHQYPAPSPRLRVVLTTALLIAGALTGVGLVGQQQAHAAVSLQQAWVRTVPAHVGRSAPVAASLGAGKTPSVVVGDQAGNVHGFSLATGASPSGWGSIATGARSIDAALSSDGAGRVFVPQTTSLNHPTLAAYSAATGRRIWGAHYCHNSRCDSYSGMAVKPTLSAVYTGGLSYVRGVPAATGSGGWMYQNSDSTNSTPAVADLMGSGPLVITTNDQTPNAKVGALSGGHLRILTTSGVPLCNANIGGGPATPGSFDSSPAIASFGGSPVIVFGSGESGTLVNRMVGYNAACQRIWTSVALAGKTIGAPAVADALGTGRPVVVELVANANRNPVVYELDGVTGQVLRGTTVTDSSTGKPCTNFAQGTASSVVTADLTSSGHQDLLVPAGSCGVVALDGRSLARIGQMGRSCAVQNTPVVTQDPNGRVGITMAGYRAKVGGGSEGCIFHYTVAGGRLGSQGWPSFHHDSRLSGALTPSFPRREAMLTGNSLPSGASLYSANGLYKVTMLTGGTLAVYQRSSTSIRWQKVVRSPGATLKVGGTSIAAKSTSGSTLWATRNYSVTRPITLVISPTGRLEMLVHSGNMWAATQVLWVV